MELLEKLNTIEGLVLMLVERSTIPDTSLAGSKIKKVLPDKSVTKALENILKPQYMNTVYTWGQIKRALTEFTTLK